MKKLIFISLCLLVALLAAPAGATPVEEWFEVSFYDSEFSWGDGSGYDEGAWFYYENTGWWNQWYYDAPPDLERMKVISFDLFVNVGAATNLEIAINWSTMEYPENPAQPPLPPLTVEQEDDWIVRQIIVSAPDPMEDFQFSFDAEIEIPDYNPEWVSIDIRFEEAGDLAVQGTIWHECLVPEPATIVLLGLGGLLLRRRKSR